GVRGTVGARVEAGGTWGLSWQVLRGAVFYAVTAGTAWLSLPGQQPRQLMPGDVVLLPHGTEHGLSSAPGVPLAPCQGCDYDQVMANGNVVRLGTDEVQTHILGATYEYDPTVTTQIMAALPALLHLRADNGGTCLDD